MSDLNLNFDNGIKNITMGSSGSDNIQVDTSPNVHVTSHSPQPLHGPPQLSVSDPMGIEFLTKVSAPSQPGSGENTPKSGGEEFSFFKPTTEGIVDGNLPKSRMDRDQRAG